MKVAVVTGCSSGIGYQITKELLEHHFKVYGVSRTKPDITNRLFCWIKLDLTNPTHIHSINNAVSDEVVDVLIHVAGTAFKHPGLKLNDQRFHKIFDLNFFAPIYLTSSLQHKLTESVIINISSTSDRIAEAGYGLYCSSKAALEMYFDVIALEHPKWKVINILPDYVDTPLLRKEIGASPFDWSQAIQPSHVARLITTIINDNGHYPTGSRVMIINNKTLSSVSKRERLFAYNVDTHILSSP